MTWMAWVARRAALLAATAMVFGCAVRHGDGWLEELRQREATLPESRMIGASDGAFGAEVPAIRSGSVVTGEQADMLSLDIGSDSPIECALYHDEVESASTVQTMAEQVFADLEERYGVAVKRSIVDFDAGLAGPSPYLELHWQYQTDEPQPVFGELEQMIASREGRSVYCVHHENGYRDSFRRVVSSLIETIRFAEYDTLRPYYTQVALLSSAGQRFGYSIVSLTLDDDGDPRVVLYSARLGRADDGGVTARDVTEVEHASVGGVLHDKMLTDYRDGEVARSLWLEDLAGAGWRVSGEVDGGKLLAVFEQPQLSSWLGDASYFRGMMTLPADERTVESHAWMPEIDADQSVSRTLHLFDRVDGQHYRGSVDVGDWRQQLVLDPQGAPVSSTGTIAGREVSAERVFVEGALY